jgi:predicted RNase H-like HicB family nuclease
MQEGRMVAGTMDPPGLDDVDLTQVHHCSICGQPMIAAPVVTCGRCDEEHKLRCFTYRASDGTFIAECLDLDILSQGATVEEAIGKLQEAMFSYMETAFDGEPGCQRGLVMRRSPWTHQLRYYIHFVRELFARLSAHRARHSPEPAGLGHQHLYHC